MVILQGIMDELPPFEKYWTHMFENKSMHVVDECQSKGLNAQFDIITIGRHKQIDIYHDRGDGGHSI